MSTLLHVITPGEVYVPGGTETAVDLYCLDPNRDYVKVLNKIEKVYGKILGTDPVLQMIEVIVYEPGLLVLTKITNACSTEITYVTEYLNDVIQSAICCLATPPVAPSPDGPIANRAWNFGSSVTDPYVDLSGGTDTIVYDQNGNSVSGAFSVDIDTTGYEEDLFFVFREKKEQPNRHHYFNSDVIRGAIPDSIFRATFEVGAYHYTITRVAATLDQNYHTKFTS